jgi:tyrosine-protein kinase Etk/Wzc
MLNQNLDSGTENLDRYKERLSNFSKEFEFGLFIYLLAKSILWIIGFFILCGAGAFLILRYTPQTFEANSVIQIQQGNSANRILSVDNSFESQDYVSEAIEFLRSREFLRRALLKLPLRVGYFAEGTFLENEHYRSSGYEVKFDTLSEPAFGKKFYVDFKNEKEGEITLEDQESASFLVGEQFDFAGFNLEISLLSFEKIQNENEVVKKNAHFFVLYRDEDVIDRHSDMLSVTLLNDAAKTINVSCKENNPIKARDIVNSIALEYLDFDKEKKGESSKKILAFIDTQIKKVEEDLRLSESSIVSFKKGNQMAGSEKMADLSIGRINNIETELLTLNLQASVYKEIESTLQKNKEADAYSLIPMLSGSDYGPIITKQMDDLAVLLKKRDQLLVDVTLKSDNVKKLDDQIVFQKKMILESLESIREKINARRKALDSKLRELTGALTQIPTNEVEFQRLQRFFTVNEKFYTLLLEKRTEYEISQAGNVSTHNILEISQIPTTPIYPKKRIVYLSSVFLAILISLALVLIRYLLHDKITSLNEVVKQTNASISILGIVPKYKEEIPVSQLLVDKNPKSLMAEAFRSIRTNLQLFQILRAQSFWL